MGSSTDWFRQKMGPQPTAVRPLAPLGYPPAGPPAHAVPQAPQPVAQPQQPYPQPQEQTPPGELTVDNLMDGVAAWNGTRASAADSSTCPECGSGDYFARASSKVRGASPAPHCYACGYNGGLFTQYGSSPDA